MTRRTFRKRKIKVSSKYGYDEGKGYDTRLEIYPDQIRLQQDRGQFASHAIVILDPPAIELLIKLWQEVKGEITPN